MEKLKQTFILVLLFTGMILSNSCGEDFIEKSPQDRPNPDNFLVDEAAAKQLVVASYQPWTGVDLPNMYFKELIILMDAMTDDSDVRLNGSDRIQPRDWSFLPSSNVITDWWRYPYQSINAANYAIESIPSLLERGSTQESLDPLIAEARFMRGFSYLFLVTYYGEVPLITGSLTSFEDFSQPRASLEAIYDLIIEDFTFAKEKLTDDGGGVTGTPTKAAGAAFLAKAYLYKKDWPMAATAAQQAIAIAEGLGFGLIDDYATISDINNEDNAELVFYLQFVRDDRNFSTTMSVERNSRDLPGEFRHIQGGEGWGYALPTRDLYDAFEDGDPRRSLTVKAPGDLFGTYTNSDPFTYTSEVYDENCQIVSTEQTYVAGDPLIYNHKWSPTGLNVKKLTENLDGLSNVRYGGIDIPVMRMAELYLIYAEALAEQGNSDALNWVNRVRSRPSVNMPDKTLADGTLVDIVRQERRVELGMEGHRLADLIRWDALKETFGNGTKVKLHFYSDCLDPSNSNRFVNPTDGLSKYPSDHILLPIPQFEMDQNSEIITNNPGY